MSDVEMSDVELTLEATLEALREAERRLRDILSAYRERYPRKEGGREISYQGVKVGSYTRVEGETLTVTWKPLEPVPTNSAPFSWLRKRLDGLGSLEGYTIETGGIVKTRLKRDGEERSLKTLRRLIAWTFHTLLKG